MDNKVYWIWLSLACTIDTGTFAALMDKFDDAKAVYDADVHTLRSKINPKLSDITNLADKDLTRAVEIYSFCTRLGVGLLTYDDPRYPQALKKIPTPPPLLYYRGKLPDFNSRLFIAVVGTRSLSDYGRKNAFKISYDLATAGAIVVSGMAMGIDGVAMAAAIAADKPTVAVLGSGIDVCYPSQHLDLAREIVKDGCVLTELPPGTPPAKYNFPKRNRIISGISRATFAVEGKESSGAMITARYAKEQGRDVYVLPGNVDSANSQLANLLLKNGAKPCTYAEDIILAYEEDYLGKVNVFQLKKRCPVDMMFTLRMLGVVANCPGDEIFMPPRNPRRAPAKKSEAEGTRFKKVIAGDDKRSEISPRAHRASAKQDNNANQDNVPPMSFDKDALKLYKQIPLKGECLIEELVSDSMPLREVMKSLLKLEMGKFIVMLPGGHVARKTK